MTKDTKDKPLRKCQVQLLFLLTKTIMGSRAGKLQKAPTAKLAKMNRAMDPMVWAQYKSASIVSYMSEGT